MGFGGYNGHYERGKSAFKNIMTGFVEDSESGTKSWTTGTEYCQDTKTYLSKDKLVKVNSSQWYLLRDGPGDIKYTVTVLDESSTVIRLFDKKKKRLSTHRFREIMTSDQAKDWMLDCRFIRRKDIGKRPYRSIYRHIFLSKEEWDEKYKPNDNIRKKYASRRTDKALNSLYDIIEEADGDEYKSGIYSASINMAYLALNAKRKSYTGDYPVVEVFAIWSNYDTETGLVLPAGYDESDPLYYAFNTFNSKEEIEQCPA